MVCMIHDSLDSIPQDVYSQEIINLMKWYYSKDQVIARKNSIELFLIFDDDTLCWSIWLQKTNNVLELVTMYIDWNKQWKWIWKRLLQHLITYIKEKYSSHQVLRCDCSLNSLWFYTKNWFIKEWSIVKETGEVFTLVLDLNKNGVK